MNKKLAMAMGLVLAGTSAMVSAEENSMGLEFSANVAMTTDYVFRGYSQSDEELSVSGGFDVAHTSGIYAGIWGASIDGDGYGNAVMEADYYIGWAGETGPVSLDVGYLRYTYPGADAGTDADTDEYHIGVSGEVATVGLGVTYYYSDDYFGLGDNDLWEFSGEVPVGQFSIAAAYGISDGDEADGGADYDYWSIGASTEFGGFGFDLTYHDTDEDNAPLADDRVVFTVSKSL